MSEELFNAIRSGDSDRVKTLVSADPALLQSRDESGVTPLLTALYHQNESLVDLLVTFDPGLDLYEAAALGRSERVRELLDADPSLASAYSPDGWTALHLASFFGHPEVIELLLEKGAGIDMVSTNMGNTALQAAIAGNQPEAVNALVEAGADLAYKTARGGYAAIHNAAATGNREIITTLLEAGADPLVEADDGRDAAAIARERHPEVAALFENET